MISDPAPVTAWLRLRVERWVHDVWPRLADFAGRRLSRNRIPTTGPGVGSHLLSNGTRVDLENSLEAACRATAQPRVSYETRDVLLYELNEVRLVGEDGYIYLPEGSLLDTCPSVQRQPGRRIRRPIDWLARRLEGPVFSLVGANHENHGHFLMQHLPRLLAARPFLPPETRFLVAPGPKGWQLNYLACLGISPDKILPIGRGTLIAEKLFYVPQWWADNHLVEPAYYLQLREAFLNQVETVPHADRVLFLSRADAPNRRLTNEQEVVETIRLFWPELEVVHLGRLALKEQIRLVSSASLVLGPQGQDMAAGLFIRQGTLVVLESGPAPEGPDWASAYRDMALGLGLSAARLYSNTAGGKNIDWSYPPSRLREELAQLSLTLRPLQPPS